jgi:hypothetical protein
VTVQVGSKPPTRSTVPTVIAHGSNVPHGASTIRDLPRHRHPEHLGKQIANHATGTTKKNGRRITRFLAAGGVALVIGSFSLFTGACTAAADRLDVSPMSPAVVDEDGYRNHHTSSYPATPTWPAPPSWGSFPAAATWSAPPSWGSLPVASTWPGETTQPCCSR